MTLDFFGDRGFDWDDLLGWNFKSNNGLPSLDVYFRKRPPFTFTGTEAEEAKEFFQSAVRRELTALSEPERSRQQVEAEFFVARITHYACPPRRLLGASIDLQLTEDKKNKIFADTRGDRDCSIQLSLSDSEATEFFQYGTRYAVTFTPVADDLSEEAKQREKEREESRQHLQRLL